MWMFGLIVRLISASIIQDVHLMDRFEQGGWKGHPASFTGIMIAPELLILFLFSTSIIRSETDRAA